MAGHPSGIVYQPLTIAAPSTRATVDLLSGLGRHPARRPARLSRALYLARHDVFNLPVYDVSAELAASLQSGPVDGGQVLGEPRMGCRLFKTRLNLTPLPNGHGDAAAAGKQVRYLVDMDFAHKGDEEMVRVRKRHLTTVPDVKLYVIHYSVTLLIIRLMPSAKNTFKVLTCAGNGSHNTIELKASYPLPPAYAYLAAVNFPYFTFKLPDDNRVFQWQVHPIDDGPLMYMLVALDESRPMRRDEGNILAIYHHVGFDGSVFIMHSEGVLMVPEEDDANSLPEHFVLATLLGVLSRCRIVVRPKVQKGKKPLLCRLFGKGPTGVR